MSRAALAAGNVDLWRGSAYNPFAMRDPIILSTWKFGRKANEAGWPHLAREGGSSLDAVEHACRRVEADPEIKTVGYGGYPDRSGEVSLDASIMLSPSRHGAVCAVRRLVHPISLARLVMEKSPHVMLAGEGAERFAESHGMTPVDLMTGESRAAWEEWVKEHRSQDTAASRNLPATGSENKLGEAPGDSSTHNRFHDTIGVLARDPAGRMAGACSTSGLPFKWPGRVGDSPIVGHGLYVDPDHGAAVATGTGELIMGVCGSFLAVELMRRGASPGEAAAEVVRRVAGRYELEEQQQVAIVTMNASGHWSAAALRPGYRTAVRTHRRDELVGPECVILP